MRQVIFFFLKSLCERSAKSDAFTADIYHYKTTEFGYAKRDCFGLPRKNNGILLLSRGNLNSDDSKASDRAEKRHDNRKDNKPSRQVIFITNISKFHLKCRLLFFPIQTFINSNRCDISPSYAARRYQARSLRYSRCRRYRGILVYNICLISISISVSNGATNKSVLNIESS